MLKWVMVLVAVLGLAGCGVRDEHVESVTGANAAKSESVSEKNYGKPIVNDLTMDDLRGLIYVNGKQIIMPCTLKELGDGFTIKNRQKPVNVKASNGENIKIYLANLHYNKKWIARCTIWMVDENKPNLSMDLILTLFVGEPMEVFNINGNIGSGSDYQEIINFLGKPVYESEGFLPYKFIDDEYEVVLYVSFDVNTGQIKGITFSTYIL